MNESARRERALISIADFARKALAEPSQRDLINAIMLNACQILDTPHAFLDLLTPDGEAMADYAAFGAFDSYESTVIRKGVGMVGKVWESSAPLLISDYASWDGRLDKVAPTLLRAVIGVPLIYENAVIGVMGLAHTTCERHFSQEELTWLTRLADLSAGAIAAVNRQRRLEQERDAVRAASQAHDQLFLQVQRDLTKRIAKRDNRLQRQNLLLSALHETTLKLLNESTVDGLFAAVLETVKSLLNAPRAFVAMVDAQGKVMRDVTGSQHMNDWVVSSRKGEGLKGIVWATGSVQSVEDYATWPGRLADARLDSLRATVVAPMKSGDRVIGAIGVSHSDPAARFSTEEINALSSFADLATLAYFRALSLQNERRNRLVAENLRDVIREVNSTKSLDDIQTYVFNQMIRLLELDRGMLFRFNASTHELTVQAMYGIDAPYMRSIVLRVPAYSELRLRRYRRSGLVLPEVAAEYALANFQRDPVLREAFGPLLPEMRHAMLAQLAHGEDLYGGVLLYSTQQFGAFAPADYMLLEKLATQASLAIANAQLRIHSMANAAEEERSRLARDLHDSVSQALFGMTLGVETALQQLETDTAAAAESMHYALSLARAAKSEMRALIFQLRPDMLSQIGLHGAFEAQATAMKARHGLVVNLHCETAEPALPLDRKEAVYRVASEALHNIVKHAQARHVNIRAYQSDNGYCVMIRDDGIGFDATRRHIGSFGLHSMRDRIETLGGRIIIESEHGQGTSVLLCMPECS